MSRKLLVFSFLAAGCMESSVAVLPPSGEDDGTVYTDEETLPALPTPMWDLEVQNGTGVALDTVEVCFDEDRFDCLELGVAADRATLTSTFERFDMTQMWVFGYDDSAKQVYEVALDTFTPEDGVTTTVTLESLGCGLYTGTKFNVTLHSAVVYPTKASGDTWDSGVNWDDLAFIEDVVDLAVTELASDETGDLAAAVTEGLGESLEDVTSGDRAPDMVYHLARYNESTNASVSASADGFPNTLQVLHSYDRAESNDPGQANTILPIFDDEYTVTLPAGQKLYLNAYDVDFVGSERLGAVSLNLTALQSYADCGRLGNVTGTEMLMGVALTVESIPEAL